MHACIVFKLRFNTKTITINTMTDDTPHKRRKQAWEHLPTPRVSWEEFKRINDRSSSLEQAVVRAEKAIRKQRK